MRYPTRERSIGIAEEAVDINVPLFHYSIEQDVMRPATPRRGKCILSRKELILRT